MANKEKSTIICCDQISLDYYPRFFSDEVADKYLKDFMDRIEWREEHYVLYGKMVKAPRLMAWYGDTHATYYYSGIQHQPNLWIAPLTEIRNALESKFNCSFNSVLANLYRNGQDSMGWHADNEPELGKNPIIASVSFGSERQFYLRHNSQKSILKMLLQHASVLLMQGETQYFWKHALPKSSQIHSPRINLTFRTIFTNKDEK